MICWTKCINLWKLCQYTTFRFGQLLAILLLLAQSHVSRAWRLFRFIFTFHSCSMADSLLSSEFQIGTSIHECPMLEETLQLSSTCAIQLSYTSHVTSWSGEPPSIDSYGPKGIWVSRGPGLRLSVYTAFDDIGLDPLQKIDLIETLGRELRDAEVTLAGLCQCGTVNHEIV